ncbi:hypothetical protein EG028_20945 [Chitinophaga barathri]|uniref:Uncharacterized protein n=1 Tax=Chitinophaga barathri TaxID=1647451 RepID=A0A3N4MHH7_9BACT|nr:hypothetical protein EG028_20945 [Chitinophaga barathri]
MMKMSSAKGYHEHGKSYPAKVHQARKRHYILLNSQTQTACEHARKRLPGKAFTNICKYVLNKKR